MPLPLHEPRGPGHATVPRRASVPTSLKWAEPSLLCRPLVFATFNGTRPRERAGSPSSVLRVQARAVGTP